MSTLTEFLRKQKEAEKTKDVDVAKIKREWLSVVERLFTNIQEWLSDAQGQKLIDISKEPLEISEENLGKYKTHSLVLKAGRHTVKIKPIGRLIIGFNGRVDMISPKATYVLLYSAQDDVWVHSQGQRPADFPILTEALFAELLKRSLS